MNIATFPKDTPRADGQISLPNPAATTNPIRQLLAEGRYETARRVGIRLLAKEPTLGNVLDLQDAYKSLSDFPAARRLLEEWRPLVPDSEETIVRSLAQIYHTMASKKHYRQSEEMRQGFSLDEYIGKYQKLSVSVLEQAGIAPTVEEAPLATTERAKEAPQSPPVLERLPSWGKFAMKTGNQLLG